MLNLKVVDNNDGSGMNSLYIHLFTSLDEYGNYTYYFRLIQDTSEKKKMPEMIRLYNNYFKGNVIQQYDVILDTNKIYSIISNEFL